MRRSSSRISPVPSVTIIKFSSALLKFYFCQRALSCGRRPHFKSLKFIQVPHLNSRSPLRFTTGTFSLLSSWSHHSSSIIRGKWNRCVNRAAGVRIGEGDKRSDAKEVSQNDEFCWQRCALRCGITVFDARGSGFQPSGGAGRNDVVRSSLSDG
jgi:hypothetical protein